MSPRSVIIVERVAAITFHTHPRFGKRTHVWAPSAGADQVAACCTVKLEVDVARSRSRAVS